MPGCKHIAEAWIDSRKNAQWSNVFLPAAFPFLRTIWLRHCWWSSHAILFKCIRVYKYVRNVEGCRKWVWSWIFSCWDTRTSSRTAVPLRNGTLDGKPSTLTMRWKEHDPRYNPVIAQNISFDRWKKIKRYFKLSMGIEEKKRGQDGYDPCVKYDYIYQMWRSVQTLTVQLMKQLGDLLVILVMQEGD